MSESKSRQELNLLLNLYLDGELDPLDARELEARLATDPTAAAEFADLRALRQAMRSDIGDDLPPDALRHRIEAMAKPPRLAERTWSWRALAASMLVGALIAGSGTFGVLSYRPGESVTNEVVTSHIRALIAPEPTDVLSSDRHTVKPWFDGKLAYAPVVVDLADKGFPLVGGRIDVVDFQPVPTLVYRLGKHFLSLTAIPGNAGGTEERRASARGFHTISWSSDSVLYVAVSDAAPDEIEAFVEAFRRASSS
jgi:anti-sigma factor RsiW